MLNRVTAGLCLCVVFVLATTVACNAADLTLNTLNGKDANALVTGPASATSGNVPSYNGTSGKALQDSGKSAASLTIGPASAVAGNIPSFTDASGKIFNDSGIASALFSAASGNKFLASPADGTSGALTQRALVAADIPSTQATDAEVTAATADMMTLSGNQLVTGTKTFMSTISADGGIDSGERLYVGAGNGNVWAIVEGATVDSYETTIGVIDPTADRTINDPDASGTRSLLENSETMSGAKKFTGGAEFERAGDGPLVDVDSTIGAVLQVEGTVDGADPFASTLTITPGDGAVVGPKASVTADGWQFEGMMQVKINGTTYFIPYYSYVEF